jgi:hypothetical protein
VTDTGRPGLGCGPSKKAAPIRDCPTVQRPARVAPTDRCDVFGPARAVGAGDQRHLPGIAADWPEHIPLARRSAFSDIRPAVTLGHRQIGDGRNHQAARAVKVSCRGSSRCSLYGSMSSGLSVPTRLTRLETGRIARGSRTMPSRTS